MKERSHSLATCSKQKRIDLADRQFKTAEWLARQKHARLVKRQPWFYQLHVNEGIVINMYPSTMTVRWGNSMTEHLHPIRKDIPLIVVDWDLKTLVRALLKLYT